MKHILLLLLTVALLASCGGEKPKQDDETTGEATTTSVVFDADSAMAHVERQCAYGPRVPDSDAHRQCGDFIVKQFGAYGLAVVEQKVRQTMWDGKSFECRNIIAQYAPEATDRIVLCAHWDSRPWADNDPLPANHTKPVLAANDGASGVAILLEIARKAKELNPRVGIDFVCFDLEDYGTSDEKGWCVGSTYWASNPHRADYTPLHAILLDMVGGTNTVFRQEYFSLQYAASLVYRVWGAAQACGYEHMFLNTRGGGVTDDHIPMNNAGIPTIDIIGSAASGEEGFPSTWHTVNDTPKNISRETLKAVGQTLLQVLSQEPF